MSERKIEPPKLTIYDDTPFSDSPAWLVSRQGPDYTVKVARPLVAFEVFALRDALNEALDWDGKA